MREAGVAMLRSVVAAFVVLGVSTAAFAHVELGGQAAIGSDYTAVFRVTHGCAGSPTVKVRLQIPEGVVGVEPVAKQGWTVGTVNAKYRKPYSHLGKTVTEGPREVVWSGGNLPDKQHDEFSVRVFITDAFKPGTTVYFPALQQCAVGVNRWIEIPANGKKAEDYEMPAPGVTIAPQR